MTAKNFLFYLCLDLTLSKIQEKIAVERKKHDQNLNPQKEPSTAWSHSQHQELITHNEKVTVRTRNITKKATSKRKNTVDMATDMDFNYTLVHYDQIRFGDVTPLAYSPVKLTNEDAFIPDTPYIASIFHTYTPRYDFFLQPVDRRFSTSSVYLYVSIFRLILLVIKIY